jgi:hypothetical protein
MKQNSQQDIVNYLTKYPNKTENQINAGCFGYYRNLDWNSNKKYAELLRRSLSSGKIKRQATIINKRKSFIYFI